MSDREIAKSLIDRIPDNRLFYVISYLQGASVPEDTPNAATLEAMAELDGGGGSVHKGTTAEIFAGLESKDD